MDTMNFCISHRQVIFEKIKEICDIWPHTNVAYKILCKRLTSIILKSLNSSTFHSLSTASSCFVLLKTCQFCTSGCIISLCPSFFFSLLKDLICSALPHLFFFYCPSFPFHYFRWNIDFYCCCTTFYCSRFNGFPQVVASIYTFIYCYSETMTSSHYFKKVKLLNIDYNSGQNTSQQLNSPPPIVPTPEMYCLG